MTEHLKRPEGKFFKRRVSKSASKGHIPFVHPGKISELPEETTLDAYLSARGVKIDVFLEILRHCKVPEANIIALQMMWGYRLLRIGNSNRKFLDEILILLFDLGVSGLLAKNDLDLLDLLHRDQVVTGPISATRAVRRAVSVLDASDLGRSPEVATVSDAQEEVTEKASAAPRVVKGVGYTDAMNNSRASLIELLKGTENLGETTKALIARAEGVRSSDEGQMPTDSKSGGKSVANDEIDEVNDLSLDMSFSALLAEVVDEEALTEELKKVKTDASNIDLLFKCSKGLTLASIKKEFMETYPYLKLALFNLGFRIQGETY